MFKREKMQIGSFFRCICIDIVQIPTLNYKEYLEIDTQKALEEDEYLYFSDYNLELRLLITLTTIIDSQVNSLETNLVKTFMTSLYLALQDNNYSESEAIEFTNYINNRLQNFLNYLEEICEEDSIKNNTKNYLCIYYSNNIIKHLELNDANKISTIVAIINNSKISIEEYYKSMRKKVKLVY